MIKSIDTHSRYVTIYHGSATSTYVNNANYMNVGDVRFNINSQQLELYTGQTWQSINMATPTVGLNDVAETAIDWVLKKMEQEKEAKRMAEQYPAVADALGAVREAEQQLKMVVALCTV